MLENDHSEIVSLIKHNLQFCVTEGTCIIPEIVNSGCGSTWGCVAGSTAANREAFAQKNPQTPKLKNSAIQLRGIWLRSGLITT